MVFQMLENGSHNAANCDSEGLKREYLEMQKAAFNPVFGRNAERARNIIAAELNSRGISEIPNIFGAIAVR